MSIHRQNGFSLIEIMIVLLVIGIVSAISYPSFRNFISDYKLSSETNAFVSEIRKAQQFTVTEQICYLIKVFQSENKYQLLKVPDSLQPDVRELIEENILGTPITVHTVAGLTNDEIIFNSTGAVSVAGTVELQNDKGMTRVIDIKPSGFIDQH